MVHSQTLVTNTPMNNCKPNSKPTTSKPIIQHPMKKLSPIILAAIAAASLAVSTTASATSSVNDGDWSTAATWDTNTAPPAAPLGIVNGKTVTFSSGSWFGGSWNAGVLVGSDGLWPSAGVGAGTLNVTGGFLDTGYLGIGQNNTGIVNVSGGTFQSGAEVLIGWTGATSSAVNVTGGTVNFYGGIDGVLGQGAAATMGVSGTGVFDVNRNFYIRNSSALTVSTGGTVNVAGQLLAQQGTVNIAGGTLASTATVHVGYTQAATMNITSGTVTNTSTTYMGFAGGNGTITQSGGSATYQDLYLGNGPGTATINLSGGTMTVNGTLGFSVFDNGGVGVINQTGGTLQLTSITNNSATPGAYNLQAGTFRALGNVVTYNGAGAFTAMNVTGTSGNVTLDTNGFNVTTTNSSTFNNAAATLTKTGAGTFAFGNGGGLTVSSGTLLVAAGTLGTDGGTVINSGALVGGDGTIAGNLHLDAGASFKFSLTETLSVNSGTVSFGGLSIANISGLNSSVALGTYALMDGSATFNFANVANFGAGNQTTIGGGKLAYFDGISNMQVVVVPEPATWVLLAIGLTVVVTLRRRRSA